MTAMNRRKFIKMSASFAGAGAVAAAGGGAYAGIIEPNRLLKTHYDLASAKWPQDCAPLRVAIATDIHAGCPSVGLNRVEEIVDVLNQQNADVILLLGDYLINEVMFGKYVPPVPVAQALRGLKAPQGVYAVLGNHDWRRDGMGMWRALEGAGIAVLENDALSVSRGKNLSDKFWIAGLADDTTRKPDWGRALEGVTDDRPTIMMMHDPGTFLDKSQRPALALAGHTHGGQVRLPFLEAGRGSGRAPLRYVYGHVVEDGCDMIVSSGIGTSRYPIRFNAPPEIVTLNIGPSHP